MKQTKKNGWQVAIDLCYNEGENKNLLNSPLFDEEEKADSWYRGLDLSESEWNLVCDGVDFIMIQWVDGKIENTYII